MTAQTTIAGVGKASRCEMTPTHHRPLPARYVWHHLQPQVAGGASVPENLRACCDSCHYTIHHLMYQLKLGIPLEDLGGDRAQRKAAMDGYERCLLMGTVDLIPNEG